jgi:hypothetical protein
MSRYLSSRKNLAGMAGAVLGVGLHLAGVIGDLWPVVAVALYGAGALVGPSDPKPEPPLIDALRADAAALRSGLRRDLPPGAAGAVTGMLDVLAQVLDRLEKVADSEADRVAAPERLARVASIVRDDLPACLATYGARTPRSADRAAAELVEQLGIVAAEVDRLAAEVPDLDVRRAEELTDELRRRYGAP